MSRQAYIMCAIAVLLVVLNIWHSPQWIWVSGPFIVICVLWFLFANKFGVNAKDSRGYIPPADGGNNSLFKD